MKFFLSLIWPEVTFSIKEEWQGGQKHGPFKTFKGTSRQKALEKAGINTYGLICEKLEAKVWNGETIVLKLDKKTTILSRLGN